MAEAYSTAGRASPENPIAGADEVWHATAEAQDKPLPEVPTDGLARSLERRRLQAYLAMVCADLAILLASYWFVGAIYLGGMLGTGETDSGLHTGFLLLPLFLTIALYNGSYSRRGLVDWKYSGAKALIALVLSAALLNFVAFFAKANAEFSRVVFISGLLLSAVLLIAYRIAAARQLRRMWGPDAANMLIIAAGGQVVEMKAAVAIDAREHGLCADPDSPEMLNRFAKYLRNMDKVIVSCPGAQRKAWAAMLKGCGIRGEIVDPEVQALDAIGVKHYSAQSASTLIVSTGHLGIRARAAKRCFDFTISAFALIALAPLMLVIALLIKLEDGGRVIFFQQRMGRGNSFFDMPKFRSMRENDVSGSRSATRTDERVTRIGRFIRRTSIDELPQLVSVLKGDMSLVGPRPHALGSRAGRKLFWQVDGRYWQRHSLRPGMTGLAQVRGLRGATDSEGDLSDRVRADLEYIHTWSMWRDIVILAATMRVLVHDRAF